MFWQDKRTLTILEDYTKNKISKKKSLPDLTLFAQSSPAFLQFMWFESTETIKAGFGYQSEVHA